MKRDPLLQGILEVQRASGRLSLMMSKKVTKLEEDVEECIVFAENEAEIKACTA